MDDVGKMLQVKYGKESIPFNAIQVAVKVEGYRSILPSDYCYNRINRDPASFVYPLFEQVKHGEYRYLGHSFAYNGPVLWKPIGESERQVGYWKEGKCTLAEDPRQS